MSPYVRDPTAARSPRNLRDHYLNGSLPRVARKQFPNSDPKDVHKVEQLEVPNPHDATFDLRQSASTYLPSDRLQPQRELRLRPAALLANSADHRDSEDLSERVIEAVITVQEATGDREAMPETMTGDKGYFALLEIGRLQELSLKTVISDPRRAQRRIDKLSCAQRQTLARARRSTSSKYGRALLRKRGQHIERSFAHVLDAGGMRRATLRGLENLNKRHQIAACYNLSQLLRRLYGVGAPRSSGWRVLFDLSSD